MGTNKEDNLLETLYNISQYLKVYEGALQDADSDYIISSFKLAKFVEDVVEKTKEEDCVDQFISLIESYSLEKHKRKYDYKIEFYQKATSHLLAKYFRSNNDFCDVAVKMFLALKSQEDFSDVLTNIIFDAENIAAVNEYVQLNSAQIDWDSLNYELLINAWNNELIKQNSNSISKAIDSMLNVYKIEQNIKTLLIVLNSDQASDDLKELIITKLKPKMLDRTALSEKFWMALLSKDTIEIVVQICTKNTAFLELYMNFIVYLITMFNYEDCSWIADSNSICSSVTFTDACFILRKFHDSDDLKLKNYCCDRINNAKNSIGTKVWFEIENKLID